MNPVFLIAALASIAPTFFAWRASQTSIGNARNFLRALAFTHGISAFMLAFWAFTPTQGIEPLLFHGAFLGAEVALIAGTLTIALKQQRLSWLLLAYLLGVPLLVSNPFTGFLVLGITSALIIAIFSIVAILQSMTRIGVLGIVAAFGMLIVLLFGRQPLILVIGSTIASIALAFLYRDLRGKLTTLIPESKHHHGLVRNIIRFAVLVPLLTVFLLGVTVSVHEFSHAFVATLTGCEYSQAIIYDPGGGPHANVQCEELLDRAVVAIAGTIGPLLVALLFVIIGQELTTAIAILVSGFAFVFLYGDAQLVGFPVSAIFLSTVLGFAMLILGIIKLSLFFLRGNERVQAS